MENQCHLSEREQLVRNRCELHKISIDAKAVLFGRFIARILIICIKQVFARMLLQLTFQSSVASFYHE